LSHALPTVSIVTAVFNGVDTVADALDSVAAQHGVEIEHIVIDGRSTDGTSELLRAAEGSLARLVVEPDRGIYDALNKGFALATGDVVGLLHADDVFAHDSVLARIAEVFADPAVDAAYGDLQYVRRDATDRVVREWQSGPFRRERLRWGWMPPHPTVFMRRRVLERVGPFDIGYRIAADYDHLMRLLTDPSVRVAYIPEVLVRMRVGGVSNRSIGNMLQKSREDLRAMRAHGVGGVGTLVAKNLRKLPQFF
jgi:glycosyltransferase